MFLLRIFSFKKLLFTNLAKTSYEGNTLFFMAQNSQDYFTTHYPASNSAQLMRTVVWGKHSIPT
jgi:hypothetical protein